MIERRFDQPAAQTDAAGCGVHKHPSQLCGTAVAQSDRRAAKQLTIPLGEPHPTPGIIVEDELGDRPGNIGLELQAEPG